MKRTHHQMDEFKIFMEHFKISINKILGNVSDQQMQELRQYFKSMENNEE